MSATTDDAELIAYDEALRALRPRPRARGARRAEHRDQDVLRLPDRVRRRAQHPDLPDLPRACPARCRWSTRRRSSRRSGSGWRSTARSREWCRFARKNYFYPDMPKNFQTSQYDEPIAFDGYLDVELDDGTTVPGRDRARPHGGGHRQVAARRRRHRPDPRRRLLAGRLQPRRHPADRDRHQADRRAPGEQAPEVARAYVAQLRDLLLGARRLATCGWSRARCAATSTSRCAPQGRRRARHPHRDQERQLAALGRAGGPLRDQRHAAVLDRRRHDPAGDPALARGHRHHHARAGRSPTPRTTATSPSPTWCRSRRRREWVEELRGDAARAAGRAARRGSRRTGASPTSRCATSSAPARSTLVEETVAAGATPPAARKWWLGELARRANEAGRRPGRAAASRPADVARVAGAGRRRARSTTSWPARSSTACSPARARPTRSSRPAGSASSPTTARSPRPSTRAIAANPDVADKIRDGKVAGGRRADRRGHEGDARPGRRRPGPRADPREAELTARIRPTGAATAVLRLSRTIGRG